MRTISRILIAGAALLAMPGCKGTAVAPVDEPTATATPTPEPSASPSPGEQPTATAATPSPAPSATQSAIPASFRALGTEPFWSAEVGPGTLLYSTPEDQAGKRVAVRRIDGDGASTFTATLEGTALILVVTRAQCSDGMSDIVYPLSVTRTLGSDVQRGCARIPAGT